MFTPRRSFSLVLWEEEWLVGATPSTWNFGSTGPHWSEIADFVGFWGFRPTPTPRLHPWTPLGDFRPQTPNLPIPGKNPAGRDAKWEGECTPTTCPGRIAREVETSGMSGCPSQDDKTQRVTVMFCGNLINTQTHTHTHTHARIQVFIRLRGSRTPQLAAKLNLATPLSYTHFTSQPHKYDNTRPHNAYPHGLVGH